VHASKLAYFVVVVSYGWKVHITLAAGGNVRKPFSLFVTDALTRLYRFVQGTPTQGERLSTIELLIKDLSMLVL
jgi:hypothetical protein